MSHELFMDLSDEQQELVSGGGQIEDALIAKVAAYKASNTQLSNLVSADGNGSAALFTLDNTAVESFAADTVDLSFDPDFYSGGGILGA